MSVPGQALPESPPAAPVREFIAPVLALIIGVFVLLPTAIGPIGRPFALPLALPLFVFFAVLSGIGLVAALLFSNWTGASASSLMHISHGIGNWSAVASLVIAAVFLCWNYSQDTGAAPRILNVKINPVQPEAGKLVEIELDISNRTSLPLVYNWEFEGQIVSGLRTAYIKMPSKPGTYVATATVSPTDSAQTRLDAGSVTQAGSFVPMRDSSTVRVTLEVVDSEKTATNCEATTPQAITQICHEEKSDAGATKAISPQRKGNSKSTSAKSQRHH